MATTLKRPVGIDYPFCRNFCQNLAGDFPLLPDRRGLPLTGVISGLTLYSTIIFLKCFVLIELEVGDLTHQDLGQMQMYVRYYERELMNEGDNPPIGIVWETACREALAQIEEKRYADRLGTDGMCIIRRYDLACCRKQDLGSI